MSQTLSVAADRSPTNEIVVRRATPADWVVVRETTLWALLSDPHTAPVRFSEAVREAGTSWLTRLAFDPWALAWVDGEVVGIATVLSSREGVDATTPALWVAPAWRGRGIGRRLAHEVLAVEDEVRAR